MLRILTACCLVMGAMVSFGQPVNNNFASATDITPIINGCSANAAYTTVAATGDQAAGSCWSNGPNYNVWFSFTATASQYMKVQVKTGGVEGSLQNPFVALWDASLTQLNCQNYQGTFVDIETDYFGLTAGQTYYVSVDNYAGGGYRGTFTLCLSDVVDYNYFEGALDVTGMINGCSSNAAYTTLNATPDRSAGSCWSNGPNYNRWFKFTASATQYIKVGVNIGGAEGSLQNPFVALWDASLTQVNCQNYQGTSVDIETDYVGLTAGQTYYVSVDNYAGAGYRGTFTLCLSDVRDYNYYEGAINLTDLNNWCSANAQFTTLNATADLNKGTCWSNGPNYNRWFKFTAIYSTATVQVRVGGAEGSLQNPFVALWAANGTTQLACTNYAGASVDISLNYASLTVGNTYYISVDNYVGTGYRGTFSLCVTNVDPTVYYSRADGNWATASTWSNVGFGGVAAATPPGAGNVVNIRDNNITVNSAQPCAEVNLTTGTAATTLVIDNATLTVNGRMAQTNASNFSNSVTVQNNGILSVANNYQGNRTAGTGANLVTLTSGSVAVGQDFTWSGNGGTVSQNNVTVSNAAALSVARDLSITYAGGMKLAFAFNNTSTLSVGRDMTFTSSAAGQTEAIFNNSTGMSIRRNIVRGGTPFGMLTFNGASTLTFNGTGNQQVIPASAGSGGDAISYNNVVLNNTSGFVLDFTMGGIATIPTSLAFTNGVVQTTAGSYLSMLAGSTNNIGGLSSYVSGPFSITLASATPSTVLNMPLGKIADYRPAVVTVTHSSAASATYVGELFNASAAALAYTLPPSIERVSGTHYWTIDRTGAANLTTATATITYGINDGVTDAPNLRFVKTNGSGTTWFDLGGSGTANSFGTITSDPFVTFCTITIGNALGGINPLPIELTSFNARMVDRQVQLSWGTATEVENDYFSIERSSDGLEFSPIGEVKGSGTSFEEKTYAYTDLEPLTVRTYYRLRQVDYDKTSTLSRIVAVDPPGSVPEVIAYPNPVSGETFTVVLQGFAAGQSTLLRITDLAGRVLHRSEVVTDDGGRAEVLLTRPPASGLLLITVLSAEGQQHQKIVVR